MHPTPKLLINNLFEGYLDNLIFNFFKKYKNILFLSSPSISHVHSH